jgi:hypothetical protein
MPLTEFGSRCDVPRFNLPEKPGIGAAQVLRITVPEFLIEVLLLRADEVIE